MVAVIGVGLALAVGLVAFLLAVFGRRRGGVALGGVAVFLLLVGVASGALGQLNAPAECKARVGASSAPQATDELGLPNKAELDRMIMGTDVASSPPDCPSSLLGIFDVF